MCYSAHARVDSVYFLFIPGRDVTHKAGCLPYRPGNPLNLRTTQSQTKLLWTLKPQQPAKQMCESNATSGLWCHPQNKVSLNHGTLGVSQIRNQTDWCHNVTHKTRSLLTMERWACLRSEIKQTGVMMSPTNQANPCYDVTNEALA
jgi:hypothetical protein